MYSCLMCFENVIEMYYLTRKTPIFIFCKVKTASSLCSILHENILFSYPHSNLFFTPNRHAVTVHSVTSNALRDAQKSCFRMISRRYSRVFCELCSQKTPRGTLPVNSNDMPPIGNITIYKSQLFCAWDALTVSDRIRNPYVFCQTFYRF